MKSSLSKIDNQENKQTKWKGEIEGDIRRDRGNNRGKIGKNNTERNERSLENRRGRLTKNGAAGMQKESSVKRSKNTMTKLNWELLYQFPFHTNTCLHVFQCA